MRNSLITVLTTVFLIASFAGRSSSDVNIGVTADRDGIKEFQFSVGTFYDVPQRDIEKVRARSLPDNELTVVFFLSKRMEVSPEFLVDLRLSGMSWMEITLKYGLTAEIYYVNFSASPGPPYGKAWGYYNKTRRKNWGKIRLDDSDIINLVNLKFLADKHQCSPDRIIRMVKKGGSFANIHKQFKEEKEAKMKQKKAAKNTVKGNSKGKKDKNK